MIVSFLEIIIFLLILFAFSIRTSSFQTYLAHKATGYVSEFFGVAVQIGKIDIAFLDRIYFDEFYVEDESRDTLAYIHEFYVNFDLKDALNLNFYLDEVALKGAVFHLRVREGDTVNNLQFIIDKLSSNSESEAVDFKIDAKQLKIENSTFIFDNENESRIPYGVDYAHIEVRKLDALFSDILITADDYQAKIKEFSFEERSGFELSKLQTNARFNAQGVALGETIIETPNSKISLADFALVTESIQDLAQFVDKVGLVATLEESKVSMEDVAYFAPQLKGMNDIVYVQGNTSQTVKDLALNDIILKYGKGTKIQGNFSLPDFRNLSHSNFHQKLDYFKVLVEDIERIRLPDNVSSSTIKWPNSLSSLSYIEGYKFEARGNATDIHLQFSKVNSNIGTVEFIDHFHFITDTSFTSFQLFPEEGELNQLQLEDIDLRKLTNSRELAFVNGKVSLASVKYDQEGLAIKQVSGRLKNTKVLDYSYDNIQLYNVDYTLDSKNNQQTAKGEIYVRDENLDLSFLGMASFGKSFEIDAQIDLECAMLDAIFPQVKKEGELITKAKVHLQGVNKDDFNAEFLIDSIAYFTNDKNFHTQDFYATIMHNKEKDAINVQSRIMEAQVTGIIDYASVFDQLVFQINDLFPAINLADDKRVRNTGNISFEYAINLKNVNSLLSVLIPTMEIAPGTSLYGNYDEENNEITLELNSDYLKYGSYKFQSLYTSQNVNRGELLLLLNLDEVMIRDSAVFQNLLVTGMVYKGELDLQMLFEDMHNYPNNIEALVNLQKPDTIYADFSNSYLTIAGDLWSMKENAFISYSNGRFEIENLKLGHANQYLSADGYLSKNPSDKLYVDLSDVHLEEFNRLYNLGVNLSGVANFSGSVATPEDGVQFEGFAFIEDFFINETELGEISFGANYEPGYERVNLYGNIYSVNNQTFLFEGDYLLGREAEDNTLDFKMYFNSTDIAVVNEFVDPKVVSGIQGRLNGELDLKGSLAYPILEGDLEFDGGRVNLALLGTNFYFDGKVHSVKDGVFINHIPIKDEEGNVGSMTGTLNHRGFKDFNFEFVFDLENHPTKRLPLDPSMALPVEKFLVMNTDYEIGSAYYGKAYITGLATISGTTDNLAINVNATTKKGTNFVIPMYGPTTVEEEGFIKFKKLEENEETNEKVDLTGVDLNLNIDVNKNAIVKIIFDEKVGDEISASGDGNVRMSVNQFNELAMEGIYTVDDGNYNFVLGPYKQKFKIKPGGTIQWTGDPYNALLDIAAYYKTSANLSLVMPEIIDQKNSSNEDVYSYINLSGKLMSPTIGFDIDAPNTSESGNAILSRIKSDKDELNRQFFSLLVSKSFMPLSGGTGGSSSTFLDLASSQINSILNSMTDGYNMNVNLENDELSGQFSGELGISKSFLDDRLLLSGSVGVGTRKTDDMSVESEKENRFLGDFTLEYLLNEKGTFRFEVFNRSNNNYLIQDEGRGQFTQGVGVSYKEEFYTTKDFKLLQFFMNMFRKKENWVVVQDEYNKKVPIPEEYLLQKAVREEEED